MCFLKKSNGETKGLATVGDGDISLIEDNLKVGKSLTFNGSSDQIEISEVPELAFRDISNFSIGIWVNTTATNSDPSIIGDKNWGSGINPGFVFAFTGAQWKLNIADGTTRADVNGGIINDGEWHYLLATLDRSSGSAVIYQDGISVGSVDISGISGSIDSGYPIRIAQDGTGAYGHWFEGKTGEVDIYDYVLTPEQAAGVSTVKTGVQLRKQDGTVANIPVTAEAGASASIEDGRYAYTFNGTDQYATIDNTALDFRHDGDYSISFWVNSTSTDSDPVMIGDQDWSSSSNKGLTIAFRGGNWRVATSDGAGNKADANNDSGFNDGAWHLVTTTFDRDGDMKMYVDGAMVASTSMAAVGNTDSGNPLRLAQDGTGAYSKFF